MAGKPCEHGTDAPGVQIRNLTVAYKTASGVLPAVRT